MAGDTDNFFDIESRGVRKNCPEGLAPREHPARGFRFNGRGRGRNVHIIYFGDNDFKSRTLIRNMLIGSLSAKRLCRGADVDFVKIDDWRGSAEDLRWLVRSALDRISPGARFVMTSFRPSRGKDFS